MASDAQMHCVTRAEAAIAPAYKAVEELVAAIPPAYKAVKEQLVQAINVFADEFQAFGTDSTRHVGPPGADQLLTARRSTVKVPNRKIVDALAANLPNREEVLLAVEVYARARWTYGLFLSSPTEESV